MRRIRRRIAEHVPQARRLACAVLVFSLAVVFPVAVTAAAPSNDNFANAQVLSGPLPIIVQGTTREATREPGDPGGLPPSVWYRWTPPASGRIALEYCAQNQAAVDDLVVSLFSGADRGTLQYVPQRGDRARTGSCPFDKTALALPERYEVVAGSPYRIEVGGNPSMQGSFALAILPAAPPPNDEFSGAQALDGPLPTRVVGDPIDSTDGRLWYRWTAPKSGSFVTEVCPENVSGDPSIDVFTGASEEALNRVATKVVYSHVGDCPFNRRPDEPGAEGSAFKAVAGTTYRLRVAAVSYAGRFGLALKPEEVYDLGLSLSVSRRMVPFGGAVREVVKVTNRSNVPVPTPLEPRLAFGQEINRPNLPTYAGKAIYASVRSPGGRCSHGFYAPGSKVQVFGCNVTHLAPGQSQTAVVKIKSIKGPLLLDAHLFLDDDRRGNDDAQTIVRVRR